MALFTCLNTNSQQSYHLIYFRTAVNLLRSGADKAALSNWGGPF
jgi:hypothetical protein